MQAAVLRRHGSAPEFGSHPDPRRGPGQALVRVTAAPINPLDLLCGSGTSYFGAQPVPYVPGAQGVGVVQESGTLPAGQRVWFSCDAGMAPGDGSLAQLCVVAEQAMLPLAAGVDDDLAAALGLSAIAAWMALTWRGGLRPGEHVLVLGASGTVGQVAIQGARLLGAGRVTAACRDSRGRNRAMELGADAVADLTAPAEGAGSGAGGGSGSAGGFGSGGSASDATAALAEQLREACGDRLDLVLDPLWGMPAQAALRVLSPGGRLVNLGSSAGPEASFGSAGLRSGVLSVLGYTNNALSGEQKAAALDTLLAHAAAGRLDTDREIVPLADVAGAWSRCGAAPHRRAIMIPP
jgi:NADPH:quinone reductase-like Zn-dependent oxidoreductase